MPFDPTLEHQTFDHPIPLGVFFLISSLTLGAFMKEITKKIPIPYSAAMFLVGIAAGAYINDIQIYIIKDSLDLIRGSSSTILMDILVPSMVFYSCKNNIY